MGDPENEAQPTPDPAQPDQPEEPDQGGAEAQPEPEQPAEPDGGEEQPDITWHG